MSTAARSTRRSRHLSTKSLIHDTFSTKTTTSLPPTYLLPLRSSLHQAAVTSQAATNAHLFQNAQPHIPPTDLQTSPQSTAPTTTTSADTTLRSPILPTKPLLLSKSLQTLLPALHAQSPHYITAHIHRFPYLLTAGDLLRLPFHMSHVSPGDILRLNRASLLGSRDFTLKAGTHHTELYDQKRTGEPNYIDERLFECRVRVMGVESQPMVIKDKKKQRNRKVKTVKSKHRYTVLRVMEVRVRGLEELRGDGACRLCWSRVQVVVAGGLYLRRWKLCM